MPADITGTEVIQEDQAHRRRASSSSCTGPIFANMILADEINRTPPKTQAALLEAMQERQVTVGGERHALPEPVLRARHAEPDRAGGHLPAARGAARPLHVQDPGRLPERGRGARDRPAHHRRPRDRHARPVLDGEEILALQRRRCAACRSPTTSSTTRCGWCAQTRVGDARRPGLRQRVACRWGAGPRASQYLVLGAKARAALAGRAHVACEDVRAVAHARAAPPHRDQLRRRGRGPASTP